MRVDMHMHTRRSFDSLNDPDAVVAAATQRGIDHVCITDHNEIAEAVALQGTWGDRVIVGEEVKTREGVDIIGLFIEELVPARRPARETCERIRAQGGVVYVPHPFVAGKGGGGRILAVIEDLVDAVEGLNARVYVRSLNARAVTWARERDLPTGAGSDAHTLREVGRAWVEMPAFAPTRTGFLEALRAGTIHGRLSTPAVHLGSTWAKVHKRIFRS